MTRRRALVLLASAGLVAVAAGVSYRLGTRGVDAAAGQDAAALLALTLPDLTGNEASLAQWRGKVLVVNFWATWCGPCREEMPEFVRVQKEYGDRGLQFVGVAVDDAEKVRQFATEIGLNYPALIGGYGAMELSRTLGNTVMALPFTVVVDRQGRIVLTQLGPLKNDQLQRTIDKLI